MGCPAPARPDSPAPPCGQRLPEPAAADVTRRELFVRLMGAYPTLPLSLILSAVEQYQRGLELCGDGAVERAAMDVAVDHNLSSALQSLAASGRVPRLADT